MPKTLPATANPLPLYLFGSWSILFMPDLAKTIAAIHPNPPIRGTGKKPKIPKIKSAGSWFLTFFLRTQALPQY